MLRLRDSGLVYLKTDPHLGPLRVEARFQATVLEPHLRRRKYSPLEFQEADATKTARLYCLYSDKVDRHGL
jgi:hypothetical protein